MQPRPRVCMTLFQVTMVVSRLVTDVLIKVSLKEHMDKSCPMN
jgi:hypothetical protein